MFLRKRLQPLDWLSFSVFFLLMQLTALALSTADWTDHLQIVPTVMFFALILGTALARSRFRGWAAAIFSLVYGLFLIGQQIGSTPGAGLEWADRIRSLAGRLGVFISVVFRGELNEDPLMFVLLMAVLFWILGVSGSWLFFRAERFWPAVLPAGAVLVINSYFYIGRAAMGAYVAVYVLLLLLLIVRTDVGDRVRGWKRIRAQIPVEAGTYVTLVGLGAALLMVTAAWGGPAFVRSEAAADLWRSVSSPVRRVRDRIGDAFGDLRSPVTLVYDAYGDELSLDSGSEPQDGIVMEVEAQEDPAKSGRFYWRSRTYAFYEDGIWSGTVGDPVRFRVRDAELDLESYDGREELLVQIYPKQKALRVLILPAQPLFFNRDTEVTATLDGDTIVDITMVEAQDLVYNGDLVRARASVAVPTADELREAGMDYPDWVLESYLQLPETLSGRTADLAQSITADYDNPYDQVMAVTTWLRANIDYQRVIPVPDGLDDPLDWFLFESRTGYCNWYASAEVILLRLAGIPARMAVGYASGSHDPVEQLYVVSGTDSHAWPEVFFPGIGWVEFEPTGSQPSLLRPEDPARLVSGDYRETPWERLAQEELFGSRMEEGSEVIPPVEPEPDMPFLSTRFRFTLGVWVGMAGALLAAVFLWLRLDPLSRIAAAGLLAGGMRRAGMQPPPRLETMGDMALTTAGLFYARWSRWMVWLGLPLTVYQTPYERAELFAGSYPELGAAGWKIVESYSQERYAGVYSEIWETRQAWRALRMQLLRQYMIQRIRKARSVTQLLQGPAETPSS
jgi:transglutaminase-like putative cysteine protease